MFVLCPHCQFLVALLANGTPPERCPRCDGSLQPPAPAARAPGRTGAARRNGKAAVAEAASGKPATPPVEVPPVETPPVEAPPVEAPPVEAPPVEAPPVETPPVETPPVETPPVETPPVETPPVETPPVETPPVETPPVETPPVELPPLEPAPGEAVPADPPAQSGAPQAPAAPTAPEVARSRRAPGRKPRQPDTTALPSFARAAPAAKPVDRRRSWLETAAIAFLSLLLAVQWLLADRARLAADADWRPLLSGLCGVLGCDLPAWREPHAFVLLERDVRPHPRRAGVLRVTATFRNDARWPQPWPGVLLALSDIDGQVAGARVFTAREYLGAAPTQNEIDSGQAASIVMDVVEPTPRIVAFTFDFR